jgi:penicillin-binding protein 1C
VKPLARRTLVALLLIAGYDHSAMGMPTFDEVKADFRPSDTLILDRHGEVVQRVRTDPHVRRGSWVALAEVSPALRTALVLSEDRRFYEHSGVDWRAVSSAAWGNLWNTRTRGASTLTMQLAGLLDAPDATFSLRAGPGGRSVAQKLGQAVTATQLETRWRKDQILESYLNLVPFRGELVGIDALSPHPVWQSGARLGRARGGRGRRAGARAQRPARPARVAQRACGVLRCDEPGSAPRLPGASRHVCRRRRCRPRPRAPTPPIATGWIVTGALQRRAWPASEGIAPYLARRLLATGGTTAAHARCAPPCDALPAARGPANA